MMLDSELALIITDDRISLMWSIGDSIQFWLIFFRKIISNTRQNEYFLAHLIILIKVKSLGVYWLVL